jgi:Cu2+-containing amine oxidase
MYTGLQQHIKSGSCEFVTFPEDAGSYFIKHQSRGRWNADLESIYHRTVTELREHVNNFDLGLKWIIFGKGGTHIYQFEKGLVVNTEGNHEDPEHPFRKV